jgi:transposase
VEHGFKRYRDWVKADVFKRMLDAVSDEPDLEYAMVDATIVRVHRHGQGAKGDPKPGNRSLRRRCDDKILALTDALGNLVRFVLLPGQRYNTVGLAPLIKDIEFDALIADRPFDVEWIIKALNERGAGIVIP